MLAHLFDFRYVNLNVPYRSNCKLFLMGLCLLNNQYDSGVKGIPEE